ncbi:MAG TPA: 50S ribosomal protein L13 [Bacillota bacterium]
MKTYLAKKGEVQPRWFVVDARDQVLGRLAVRIANTLRGRNKPTFTPHVDTGDFVVVVNAGKVALSGTKLDTKTYYRHSGHPGGLKAYTARQLLERDPARLIKRAVWGMLPKGRLGRRQFRKLRVYAGPDHPHRAQQPQAFPL